MKILLKFLFIGCVISSISACSGFFDKDNTPAPTPLVKFNPEVSIQKGWSQQTGQGVSDDYLKLNLALTNKTIYTVNKNGVVTATDKQTGHNLWQVNTTLQLSTGAATTDDLLIVGSREGYLLALQQKDGAMVWKIQTASEMLASPIASHGVVLAKSIDGKLSAYSTQDGHFLWKFEQSEPSLILRGASKPIINGDNVISGFANGNLAKLTVRDGSLLWQQPVATPQGSFAITRMIDIDADPIIFGNRIYVATYQGRITSLDFAGTVLWTHDISSYAGIAADAERVYVSDAQSELWAFDANTGTVDWRQNALFARTITGPVVMNNTLVVGDAEGYVHWLNKSDGHFIARTRLNSSGILATPVVDNAVLYLLACNGTLATYSLKQ